MAYSDYDGSHHARASVTVVEDQRRARVTYRNEEGQTFRVLVVQKPNPIGFRAQLPTPRK